MKHIITLSFLLLVSLFVACQPVTSVADSTVRTVEQSLTGQKKVSYAVQASDIVTYLAEAGRNVQPDGSYGFLSVKAFNEDFITFKASALTSGTNIGSFASEDFEIRVTLTLQADKGATDVRFAAEPRSNASDKTINLLIEKLDEKFRRI